MSIISSRIPYRYIDRIRYIRNLLWYANVAPRTFIVFDDKKCAFLGIAKNGTRSIYATIGKGYGIDNPKEISSRFMANRLQRHQLKNAPAYFKFAFVRNPYARIASCYRDKVLHITDYFDKHFFNISGNISFEKFVKKIAKIPDFLSDTHFKSQYSVLYQHKKLLVDYVGKLETMEQDWKKIAQQCGFEPNLLSRNISSSRDGILDYRLLYTEELADIAYQRYQNDFELLGYQQAHQELLNFIKENKNK